MWCLVWGAGTSVYITTVLLNVLKVRFSDKVCYWTANLVIGISNQCHYSLLSLYWLQYYNRNTFSF